MDYEVEPLTKEEAAWVKKLEKLLLACPSSRVELFTSGDANLTVIDGRIAHEYDLDIHDGFADTYGLVLGYVRCKMKVHAVSA